MIKRLQNWIVEKYTQVAQRYDAWNYRTFSPSNRMRLRNTPRHWVDRDHRLFHASFTVLCDFVESEKDGVDQIEQEIVELQNEQDLQGVHDQIATLQKIVELYRWYTSTDWDDPVPLDDEYYKMITSAEYISTPTTHGTYKLHIKYSNPDAMARLRAEQTLREQRFEKLKIAKLMQLCKIHTQLWS